MRPAVSLSIQFDRLACSCRGEFDLCAWPVLSQARQQISRDHHQLVVVDLSEVTFLDCAAISVLGALLRSCRAAGKDTVVVCPDGFLRRLLTMTGFAAEFAVVPTDPAAMGARRGDLRLVRGTVDNA